MKILPPADSSGTSIAIAGDTLVVGSVYNKSFIGAAYVFSRQTSGAWLQMQQLVVKDSKPDDYFSQDIAFDGDTLLIGSKGMGAYVFKLQAGQWTEYQYLKGVGETEGDNLGNSVAVHGDTLVVGARSTSYTGSVYVFSLQKMRWTLSTKLLASDPDSFDSFGWSVGVSPGLIAVGAPNHYQWRDNAGAVYTYMPDTSGSWMQVQKLVASDGGTEYDNFGYSVATSDRDGGTVVVGAPCDECFHRNGSVYVFVFQENSGLFFMIDVLRSVDKITIGNSDTFGNSVALSCNFFLNLSFSL